MKDELLAIEEVIEFLKVPMVYLECLLETDRMPFCEEGGVKHIPLEALQKYKARERGTLQDMEDFMNYTQKLGV
jgi:hypothetical protein